MPRANPHGRTGARTGDDWYCGVCGPVREPCSECGRIRPIHTRDRDGKPRCVACPPDGGCDPLERAARRDNRRRRGPVDGRRRRSRKEGGPAVRAPPSACLGVAGPARVAHRRRRRRPDTIVLRLIDTLCDSGASMIVRPPCPRCGRIVHLHRRIDGKWLCRDCTAKSRAQPCGRCGAVREAATRDEQGRPLCAHCLITDPANHETCVECGRRRPVQVRTPDGPLCGKCVPRPVLTCAVCGRTGPGVISKVTGKPWCSACKQTWIRVPTGKPLSRIGLRTFGG